MTEELKRKIAIAHGDVKWELVFKGGVIANVISGEFYTADVVVDKGIIVAVGPDYHGEREIDVRGKYIVHGFIDSHVHIESSMLAPSSFAQAVLLRGTTTVIADPHELTNVSGTVAIDYFLEAAEKIPFNIFLMLPSCVPATPFETNGGKFGIEELKKFKERKNVLGLAEMMNFPGVIFQDKEVLKKLELFKDKKIDGHAPLLLGKDIISYVAGGITSDHECSRVEEAREKLRLGMSIMIREGSATKNLLDLMPLINRHYDRHLLLATDDRHPDEILEEGHIDFMVKTIIAEQGNVMRALRLATLNPAKYFGLNNLGAIAPNYRADLLVISDLLDLKIDEVYKDGVLVVKNGEIVKKEVWEINNSQEEKLLNSVNLERKVVARDFMLRVDSKEKELLTRVIGIVPDQIITENLLLNMPAEDGFIKAVPEKDIQKLAVVERHGKNGNIAVALTKGLGLKKGAIATTVAHDSHNIIVAGIEENAMAEAVNFLQEIGGGMVMVSAQGDILSYQKLEIGGLMTRDSIDKVCKQLETFKTFFRNYYETPLNNPFITLSFLALPVIPHLKLTDKGLFDVDSFAFTTLLEKQSI
jgi:adenine deaminase